MIMIGHDCPREILVTYYCEKYSTYATDLVGLWGLWPLECVGMVDVMQIALGDQDVPSMVPAWPRSSKVRRLGQTEFNQSSVEFPAVGAWMTRQSCCELTRCLGCQGDQ